jgi:hypothetical protein
VTRAPIIPAMTLAFGGFCLGLACLIAPGCEPKPHLQGVPAANVTGEAIVRADVRRESAMGQIELASPHTRPAGKPHLQTATADLQKQGSDLADASAALQAEREMHARALAEAREVYDQLRAERDRESGRWYVVGGRAIDAAVGWVVGWIRFLLRWSWLLLIGSIVLRAIALALPGTAGAALAWVSQLGFGILSGGVSLITSVFDNLWFRRLSPAAVRRREAAPHA